MIFQFSGSSAERMKKVYGKFCSRHNEAVNLYKDLHAKDKRFQTFIKVSTRTTSLKNNIMYFYLFLRKSYKDDSFTVLVSIWDFAEGNEQQYCTEAQYSRVYPVSHTEDHQVPCSHPEDTTAHQRSASLDLVLCVTHTGNGERHKHTFNMVKKSSTSCANSIAFFKMNSACDTNLCVCCGHRYRACLCVRGSALCERNSHSCWLQSKRAGEETQTEGGLQVCSNANLKWLKLLWAVDNS